MGLARDLVGSYRPMLTASAVLPLILAIVALWARRDKASVTDRRARL
jgi:hypothetical protein